jgi:hypothetical protein
MRQPQVCKHQVCDHCGGRFGMVTHRWWGNKFCKRTCKEAYLREVTLNRDIIRRWLSLPLRQDTYKFLSALDRVFGRNRVEGCGTTGSRWKRHSGPLSPKAIFVVSFLMGRQTA